jgi:hypothetical protein
MQFKYAALALGALCALGFIACAHAPSATEEAAQRRELIALLASQDTPESLASAALLASIGNASSAAALDFSARAVARAPARPELVWEQHEVCARWKCAAAAAIEAHLKAIDPDNGLVWLQDLARAQAQGSSADITAALRRIGTSARVSVYWATLVVMLFGALGTPDPAQRSNPYTHDTVGRALYAFGLLPAFTIPLHPLGDSCRVQDLDEPARRAACEALVARLEESDSALMQSYALSIQEHWWPAGSAEREAVNTKRRRFDYLIAMSGQVHLRVSRDLAIHIEAARHHAREEDVEIAVLKAYGIALEPPPGWRDTLRRP